MLSPRSQTVALHVEAAKRILTELDAHAARAMRALEDDSGAEFFAAIEERSRGLVELDSVVDALSTERSQGDGSVDGAITSAMIDGMARAAAAALESQTQLVAHTQRERNRLAGALQRVDRPDAVAIQYATAVVGMESGTFSVTG